MTAAGEVQISRVYFHCSRCQEGRYALDERLGVPGRFSHQAQRLMCLAAASWSYEVSADRLAEFCGLPVCETTIREVAQRHGAAANEWLRSDPAVARDFREQSGDVEFTTDGTSVNTTGGWREMKLGMFCKRDRGAATSPADWDRRRLPAPKVRVAFAAIEQSARFGRRWKAWSRRLGLRDGSAVTLLADGAKWIWEEQRQHLRQADGVLDVFHALEHVSDTSKVLHTHPDQQQTWTEAGRTALLGGGWSGIAAHVQSTAVETPAQQAAVDDLLAYLGPHEHHLNYAERLARGQSIGSGQVEGACKNLIGRRLKQTGARWRPRRVNRMAGLCCLMYSNQWETYWNTLTA